MKKVNHSRLVMLVTVVLVSILLLSACSNDARLPTTFTYSPGAAFSTNIRNEDPRRVLKCSVVFTVIDEAASVELSDYNYAVRNAILIVLSGLTIEELTTNKDLQDISRRLVEQVNEAIPSHIDLVVEAYFVDFALS